MKYKIVNIVKSILPPFIISLYFRMDIFLNRNKCSKIIQTASNRAIIIGNGPSLNKTIELYISVLQKYDCFMVNQSVESDYYEIVKPKYYVLADSYYFENGKENEKISNIVSQINYKTRWSMTLLVPYYGKNSYLVQTLSNNKLINIVFFNATCINYDYLSKKYLFKMWKNNKLLPLSQTVLNTSISLSITIGYKEVYLVGADTSWIENLRVDQSSNDIYTTDKHFYGDKKVLLYNYNTIQSNIAEELGCIKRSFESYQLLKEYGEYYNANIYNASEYSLIDTLPRKKLSEI